MSLVYVLIPGACGTCDGCLFRHGKMRLRNGSIVDRYDFKRPRRKKQAMLRIAIEEDLEDISAERYIEGMPEELMRRMDEHFSITRHVTVNHMRDA